MRTLWLIIYYAFARKLPKSTIPVLGKMAYRLRYRCAKHLFAECGDAVNVEQDAYIGNGKHFRVGNNVGIGKDFCSHNRPLIIHDRLLMGENVLFEGGGTLLRKPRRADWFSAGNRDKHTLGNMRRCVDRCAGDSPAGLQAYRGA